MPVCPTCSYSWDAHDETDAQRCYVQWQFRQRARARERAEERLLRRAVGRTDSVAVWASPAWREPYLERRVA